MGRIDNILGKDMKKILLIADMEGCCGLYDMTDAKECRYRMESELKYILDTLHQMGYVDMAVLDCHNDGKTLMSFCEENNIKFYNHIWSLNDAQKYDCAFLIGFHSKKGVEGYFSHTIRPDIDQVLLGENDIGEVELLINWMAFYGVPVVYISGDESVKSELENYNGEFVATKSIGGKRVCLDYKKADILTHIKSALSKEIKMQYVDCRVVIKLVGTNYIKFMPRELFEIDNNAIIFRDTIEFVRKLRLLCDFLNIAEMSQYKRIKLLIQKIKNTHQNLSSDVKANKLLNEYDWRMLDDNDIYYLSRCCES